MRRMWAQLSLAFGAVVIVSALLLVALSRVVTDLQQDALRGQLETIGREILFNESGVIEEIETQLAAGNPLTAIVPLLEGLSRPNRAMPVNFGFELVDTTGVVLLNTLDGPDKIEATTLAEGTLRYQIRGRIPQDIPTPPGIPGPEQVVVFLVVIGGGVGVIGGILMSRRLSAPLSHIAAVAREFGGRRFDKRLQLQGTEEMRDVARAFNEMAGALQEAEQIRNNLITDVAHELRTPLAVMESNLRALIDDVFPLTKDEILRLADQTRQLTRLVNDLHTLALADARQLTFQRGRLDVGAMAREVADIFGSVAEVEGVRLEVQIDPAACAVDGDGGRLRQVLQNLLVNALRYTPPEGLITLAVVKQQNAVEIAVTDSGKGIAREHLSHIFERFYRADASRDRSSGGTGLGLSIGKAIVEAHGGTIRVESQTTSPSWTRFTIRLPA